MTEAGTRIEKSEVFLPEGPLKETGGFEADVILHPEVRFTVTVTVTGEQGEDPAGDDEESVGDTVEEAAEDD